MWPTVFKVIGGSLLTFAIVWALVLGWWQSNDYEPSKLDLALYLGALPLALVGGYLLLRGFIEHLQAPPAADKPDSPMLKDEDPLAVASAKTAEAERSFRISLLESFVVTAAGASTDEIFAAMDAGKRPEPSFKLADDAGFPVFLAEVENLDGDSVLESVVEAVPSIGAFAVREDVARSLALVDRLLGPVREFVASLIANDGERMHLRIVWLIPSHWDSSQFPGLRSWLQSSYWPIHEWPEIEISLIPVANEADAMHQLDEINLRSNRENSTRGVTLLLAAVSSVDELSVEHRASRNLLFSAACQDRPIPGEGAVALLLAAPTTAEYLALPESVSLSRVSQGRRDKSVDASGRVDGKLIGQLVARLLDVTAVDCSQIKTAVFDADHRSSRITEAMEGVGQTFEHLDPVKDCLPVGTVSGDLFPIGSLVALACARAKVLGAEAPALCLSNQNEYERAVLIASPFTTSLNNESSST